jgi:aminopeptidase YwaD
MRWSTLGLLVAAMAPLAAILAPGAAAAEEGGGAPPLLPESAVQALAAELSGTAARHTVQELTLHHRMRGSRGFAAAAARIAEQARAGGLAVEVISLPADGTVFYGTQRSRPAWDASFAELWEQRPAAPGGAGNTGGTGGTGGTGRTGATGSTDGTGIATTGNSGNSGGQGGTGWVDAERIASWEARPITLAEDSAGGEAAADLVDVGDGTHDKDYEGKDVRGKLVLVAAQPGAAAALAAGRYGAAGIVSYAPNQVTAWWREDENLVRWGHLATFPPPTTFAFMVSLKQARAWQQRLAAGGTVHLRARVEAGQHPGSYDIVTAVIPGQDADPAVAHEEIVLSCHLDHQRPGANDNASGCATILEVARTLSRLIHEGRLAPPRRTLRFVWPPEVEGTIALLNARPAIAARARAVVHMDMVGGDAAATGAVFHLTRAPRSLPQVATDVAEAFTRFVNAQSDAFAGTGSAQYPLADPEGSKRALQAEVVDFTPGSDHEVWSEGSFRVPAIYLNDWPDRYIHTHADALANIDATKLLRAAFIGAASAYYLANLDAVQVPALWEVVRRHALARTATALARRDQLLARGGAGAGTDGEAMLRFHLAYERGVVDSIAAFAPLPAATRAAAADFLDGLAKLAGVSPVPTAGSTAAGAGAPRNAAAARVYRRNPEPRGPMTGFGYSYFEDQAARHQLPAPALLARQGLWGSDYAYEALNLVDGHRTVSQIRDALTAIDGPVPVDEVAEYLDDLERIGVLAVVPSA